MRLQSTRRSSTSAFYPFLHVKQSGRRILNDATNRHHPLGERPLCKSPDIRPNAANASKSETLKPEPLAFLMKGGEPAREEISENTLAWLDYDPSEEVVWPDLSGHGFNLGLAVLPSGKIVDTATRVDPRGDDVRASIAAEKVFCDELGFRHHPSGVMFRPHQPLYVEEFAQHFPIARATTLPLSEFVRVPSRETPDFFGELRKKQRRFPGSRISDGDAIVTSSKLFIEQEFERVGEVGREGLGWVEIKTSEQAKYAAEVSMTSIDVEFEAEKRDNEGRPAPHRWFMLVTAATNVFEGRVIVAAPGPGFRRRGAVSHVAPVYAVAQCGASPYPEWAPEIAKLAEAVHISMPSNHAGKPIETDTDPQAAQPSFGWGD